MIYLTFLREICIDIAVLIYVILFLNHWILDVDNIIAYDVRKDLMSSWLTSSRKLKRWILGTLRSLPCLRTLVVLVDLPYSLLLLERGLTRHLGERSLFL